MHYMCKVGEINQSEEEEKCKKNKIIMCSFRFEINQSTDTVFEILKSIATPERFDIICNRNSNQTH